ncbi:hypothetical protein ACNKHS_04850 [Shigella flexneri]
MVERTQQATFAVHFQSAAARRWGADVAGEDGIVVGESGFAAPDTAGGRLIARFGEIASPLRASDRSSGLYPGISVRFFFQQRQQGGEGGFNIAYKRHIHLAARANAPGVMSIWRIFAFVG